MRCGDMYADRTSFTGRARAVGVGAIPDNRSRCVIRGQGRVLDTERTFDWPLRSTASGRVPPHANRMSRFALGRRWSAARDPEQPFDFARSGHSNVRRCGATMISSQRTAKTGRFAIVKHAQYHILGVPRSCEDTSFRRENSRIIARDQVVIGTPVHGAIWP
jgi:hypothetical protein